LDIRRVLLSSSRTRRALDRPSDASRIELRAWAKAVRAAITDDVRAAADAAIMAHLRRLTNARCAGGWVAAYSPFGTEPAAARLWAEAQGWKHVCLPIVSGREMRFVASPAGPTRVGAWNISEPDPETDDEVAASSIVAVLVPGLVFAANGNRLGYGGGYYDRWFAASPTQAIRIGICYDCQRVDRVPSEDHDQPLDFIVTETGCWPALRDTPRSD
jgi:5-formyltetrahydrofolate cyclo-ligase